MVSSCWGRLVLLSALAVSVANAATVPQRGNDVQLVDRSHHATSKHPNHPSKKSKKKHPKHPKKHPHPHPHPHPAGGALPTGTIQPTVVAATQPAALPTPAVVSDPSPAAVDPIPDKTPVEQISCISGTGGLRLLNVPYSTYAAHIAGGNPLPNPYLSFDSDDVRMQTKSDGDSIYNVDIRTCTSKYMGYSLNLFPRDSSDEEGEQDLDKRGQDAPTYGLLRVPGFDDQCIVASDPGQETTFFLAPCSTDDDKSQLKQYFIFKYVNQQFVAQYLGAPFSQTNDKSGLHYVLDTTTTQTRNQVTKNNIDPEVPVNYDLSFYFGY